MTQNVITDFEIGNEIKSGLFGGNFLFHKNDIGELGNFDEAVQTLGIEGLRYPGGAISEVLFDIKNPDARIAIDPVSGDEVEVVPISDFLAFAAEVGSGVTIVVPTRHYLSLETDALGDRFAEVDESALRTFATDVMEGKYGHAKIDAFEVGNEYWGVGDFDQGSMSSLEYGRVASEMTRILDDALGAADTDQDPSIVVQIGLNHRDAHLRQDYIAHLTGAEKLAAIESDYGIELGRDYIFKSDDLDWARIANKIIINEFEALDVVGKVDGISAHVYSRAPEDEGSRYRHFDTIEKSWGKTGNDVELWITEWNQKAVTNHFDAKNDFGLKASGELIDLVGVFGQEGVTGAHIWAIQHNTKTALTDLQTSPDAEVSTNATGEMFKMMQENLIGTRLVDMDLSADRPVAFQGMGYEFHGFASETKFVGYFSSTSETEVDVDLSLQGIATGWESASITRLGVEEGCNPGDPRSPLTLSNEDPHTSLEDGEIITCLAPFEILQVVLENPNFTPEMKAALTFSGQGEPMLVAEDEEFEVLDIDESLDTAANTQAPAAAPVLFAVPMNFDLADADGVDLLMQATATTLEEAPQLEEAAPEEAESSESGGGGGLEGMLGLLLLPLLAVLGMG